MEGADSMKYFVDKTQGGYLDWTEICLSGWVYETISEAAVAQDADIRDLMGRLFRGALRRQKGPVGDIELPFNNCAVKKILISPKEILIFKARFLISDDLLFKWAVGRVIKKDLLDNFHPEARSLQQTTLDLAYTWPFLPRL